jgi:predicted permease
VSAPRWAAWLVRRASTPERADDLVGDLEEAHARRVAGRGALVAALYTGAEALDLARGLLWERARSRGAPVSLIDFKLGVRMLVRYPGLTVMGGIALAFGICVGTAVFEAMHQLASPTLPFQDGERVVAIRVRDAANNRTEYRTLQEFADWRDGLRSIQDLAAYRTVGRNVRVGVDVGEPATIAETGAAAFRIAGTTPALGRVLTTADERADAGSVVLVGYEAWQTRLSGDPSAVGRTILLGDTPATVVGVMPRGYDFPMADFWVPFRLNPLDYEPLSSPPIMVFGRLADAASMDEAQLELEVWADRAARQSPSTHGLLRPSVVPFTQMFFEFPGFFSPEIATANLFVVALMVLLSANVALLVFARSATRESELVVRSALGAGRRRIIGQLFAEALVLAVVATVVGVWAGARVFDWGIGLTVANEGALPFWIRRTLSPLAVGYGAILGGIAAAVAGVVPGMKATRDLGARLKQGTAGGGGMRFGGVWTAVIVVQVALTVTFPAFTIFLFQEMGRQTEMGVEVPFDQYLTARIEGDAEAPRTADEREGSLVVADRYASDVAELERRLAADPAVASVTFADALPRVYHPSHQIEVDEGAVEPPDARGLRVGRTEVRRGYFGALGAPVLSGRDFDSRDVQTGAPVVIVDEPFVERILAGRNPIGRRIRYVWREGVGELPADAPWYEIVGVVDDLGIETGWGRGGIYHVAPANRYPANVLVHVRGEPHDYISRIRMLAASVDPTLQLLDARRLDEATGATREERAYWLGVAVTLSAITLMLSLAGIYSVMSFTVSRRTREIGVRVALGANPRRIVASTLRRPLRQVISGILAGAGLVTWMVGFGISTAEELGVAELAWIAGYAALMLLVCMLACVIPARRALRIEPKEALTDAG